VAWAAARKDVLSGLCWALALVAYARRARLGASLRRGAALFAALALGLLAKPVLVTLPCVLLLLDVWPLRRLGPASGNRAPGRLRRVVVEKLPLFALVAASSAVTLAAQRAGGALQTLERYSLLARLENAVNAYPAYVAKAFWPVGLSVFYPHAHGAVPGWRTAVSALLLVAVSAWVIRELRRRPYLAVGWFWFVGTLLPVIGLVQVGQAAMADRYTYVSLTGLAVMVAWGVRDAVGRRRPLRIAAASLALLVLGALAVATWQQARTWRSSATLFEHALHVTENNHVAHINLGLVLLREDRLDEAERHLTAGLASAPASAIARGLRGDVRSAQGRHEEAIGDYRAALLIDPGSERWEKKLARALLAGGRLEEAELLYGRLLVRSPGVARLHADRGLVLFRLGRRDDAIASYRRALRLEAELRSVHGDHGVALVHERLAAAFVAGGDLGAAAEHLEAAARLEPGNGAVEATRAEVLGMLGRERDAITSYREALRLGTRSPRVLNNLAWLLATAQDSSLRAPDEAVALAAEAARATRGDDPGILDTLSVAQSVAGHGDEAEATARRALALAEAQGRGNLAREIRDRLDGEGGAAP
jgi:tetratricopeptide (TPR) repeat protein